jgi:hypothetical protein
LGSIRADIPYLVRDDQIDPDKINSDQIERLRQFKEKTYPKGLVAKYKEQNGFREKFARDLERKISELQTSDASGQLPLSLEFLSVENGEPRGNRISHTVDHPNVSNFEGVPEDQRDRLKQFTVNAIRAMSYFPIVLAINNSSSSGIRKLYVELDILPTSNTLEVSKSRSALIRLGSDFEKLLFTTTWLSQESKEISSILERYDKITEPLQRTLEKFEAEKLQREELGWKLSFEWEALQPQRLRLIKPVLYIYSPESADLSLQAKVFADSLPKPLMLNANIRIDVKQSFLELTTLIPDWEKLTPPQGRRLSKT